MDVMFQGNEMTSKARILVLHVAPYDMINERQEKVAGCTVRFLYWGENGEAASQRSEWDPRKPVGVQVAKCSIDLSMREKMPVAPAIYAGEFVMSVGSDGKSVMKLRDVAYVCNVIMGSRINPGFQVPGMVSAEDLPASYKLVEEAKSSEPAAKTEKK